MNDVEIFKWLEDDHNATHLKIANRIRDLIFENERLKGHLDKSHAMDYARHTWGMVDQPLSESMKVAICHTFAALCMARDEAFRRARDAEKELAELKKLRDSVEGCVGPWEGIKPGGGPMSDFDFIKVVRKGKDGINEGFLFVALSRVITFSRRADKVYCTVDYLDEVRDYEVARDLERVDIRTWFKLAGEMEDD